ncbi:MAG: TonB-dependent receptor [Leptolyngbya sp. SIO1E4]|nr:TonB-dependent receptor [Leptolyngbya sp. SIO1E4]
MLNQLQLLLVVSSALSVLSLSAIEVRAEEVSSGAIAADSLTAPVDTAREAEPVALDSPVILVETLNNAESAANPPATTVEEWQAQIAQSRVTITNVRVEETEAGLQIVLETAGGDLTAPATQTVGEALIAEIPNAVLELPEGEVFEQFGPAEGIALVSVTNLPGDRVQISITGTDAVPQAQISADAGTLVLSVVPGVAQAVDADDDAIQVVVTGEEDEGYNPSNASTATRTDTPLRDTPQSIQVVPRQVIEDQQAQSLQEVTRNVSGVFQGNTFGTTLNTFIIRGFETDVFLRDGFRDPARILRETADLERVEVLKGPASVLYGTLEPGGIINLVTKQPLEAPLYSAELTVGSFGFVEPSIDLGGPLNEDGTVLYRLNALYESGGNFRDFDQGVERIFVSPSLTWRISDNTDITFNFDYLNDERPLYEGIPAIGDSVADIPFDRILNGLDDVTKTESFEAGYLLEHRFSDNWRLRNNFRFNSLDRFDVFTNPRSLDESTGILTRRFSDLERTDKIYSLQTNVVGEFSTGSVEHTLLFGIDLFRETLDLDNRFSEDGDAPSINIFNPEYGLASRPERDELPINFLFENQTDTLGIYLQNQIKLSEQWQLLAGGRFDIVDQESDQSGSFGESSSQQQEEAFSPRLGIVYQPIEPLSLYASYAQSFVPNSSVNEDGNLLEPERGMQYEVGIRGEFFDGNLSATLAAFNINKTNIAIADPDLEGVSRPIGEQRSRGIELDVRGEILPGWSIFGSYAYTDAEITEDDGSELEGNRPRGIPEHAASLWTTYEIQEGDLQGLGFGAGVFFVGEREGLDDNSFQLTSYTRTDASIFYQRNNWRAGLNFQNLFDIDYIESADDDRLDIYPGIPFTVLATFSVEF